MGKSKNHEKKSKKKHKHKDRKEKKKKSKKSKEKKIKTNAMEDTSEKASTDKIAVEEAEEDANFDIPVELMNNNKSHAPQTPEEYLKKQSHIRRVTDPVSGRIRLIRGDGEVLEEIVSKDRHLEINKTATHGDGRFFQHKTIALSKTKEK